MKKLFGYILAGLLILPLIFVLPACKKADDGGGLGEKLQRGAGDSTSEENVFGDD